MIARPLAKIPAVALVCAILWSAPAHAGLRIAPASTALTDTAPAAAPPPAAAAPPPAAEAPTPATAAPPTGDPNDLTALREQAVETATSEPTPEHHRTVAQLAERAGDFAAAEAAYDAELAALGPDDAGARARVNDDLARVRERSRGAVADEGASTHRVALDAKWDGPSEPVTSKPSAPPAPGQANRDDRIVRKWYFWVTLAAIAASAAAVTGIAIKASRDDKPDALDRMGRLPMAGPGLRF